jgi:hypothetical protein
LIAEYSKWVLQAYPEEAIKVLKKLMLNGKRSSLKKDLMKRSFQLELF